MEVINKCIGSSQLSLYNCNTLHNVYSRSTCDAFIQNDKSVLSIKPRELRLVQEGVTNKALQTNKTSQKKVFLV